MLRWLTNLSNRAVLGILIGVALLSSGLSLVVNLMSNHANFAEWSESWLQNFSTEMFGAFLTFVLLTLVVGNRQEKERLIRQMGSNLYETAVRATEELRENGWLSDGTLKEARLRKANLQGIDLQNASLQKVYLAYSNLKGTDLYGSDLTEAFLYDSDLRGACLRSTKAQIAVFRYANLQGANLLDIDLRTAELMYANLQGVVLQEANLRGTNLQEANLQEADLTYAQFDEHTILPDGSEWKPKMDLTRFTNHSHPQFWRSDNPDSPAYRGKQE